MFKSIILNATTPKVFGRPVGAYRIASILRDDGWDCEVIDFLPAWKFEEITTFLKSVITKDTKFVGVSLLFNNWVNELDSILPWIKTTYPNIKIIVGSGYNFAIDNPFVDYYIQGFGEDALDTLLKYLFSNGASPKFGSIGKYTKVIRANDFYPAFPKKSLMVKYVSTDFIESDEWLTVEFSRGCKFECDFCNFPVLGVKGDYTRDADDLREQLQLAHDQFGVTNYLVADETFNDSTEKITKFADAVEQLSFKPYFSGFVRPDLLVSRKQDREELLRMGFLGHYYGVESFNQVSAKAVGKGMNPEKLKTGLVDLKNYFVENSNNMYRGSIGMIVGLPGETESKLDESKQWFLNSWKGQTFQPWWLLIPTGDVDKKSKMSLDYNSYGYSEMDESLFTEEQKQNLQKYVLKTAVRTETIFWESPQMNIFKAMDITFDWIRMLDTEDFKLCPFKLSALGYRGSVEDRLKRKADDHPNPEIYFERGRKYIEQKLGVAQ
jgi:radical SAM superfamily enzyme YgiQ (UPF0313 family)